MLSPMSSFILRVGVCCFMLPVGVIAGAEDLNKTGWTHTGPLSGIPERKNDRYPLSDQDNTADWRLEEGLTDEFDGDGLDGSKWWSFNPRWWGREPALFMPGNVSVRDGLLRLTANNGTVPKAPNEKYHSFTTAAVQSKVRVKYGYFETRAKAMRSAVSSAFWFYYHDDYPQEDSQFTEIDVFEIGAAAPGFERQYHMNAIVHGKNKRHAAGVWVAPWDLADDFHVYGLEWDERELKYYVDGALVRRLDNTAWHQALTMNFDSETMPDWFGLPKAAELPATFEIDYVRTWRKAGREKLSPAYDKPQPDPWF